VFVAPGVEPAAARAAIGGDGAQARWLAPGFPPLDQPLLEGALPSASLLREADAALPDGARLRVVVPRELAGLDGERVQLAHALDWQVVDGRAPDAAVVETAPIRFALRHALGDEAAARWLRAAVQAWNQREPGRYVLDEAPLDAPLDPGTQWLAWFAPELPAAVSNWIEAGGTALRVRQPDARGEALWRDGEGRVLARVSASGDGRIIALPAALEPAALPWLLDADFPERLLAALQGPATPPDRADAEAVQPRVATVEAAGAKAEPFASMRPLDAWLALLVAALFLVERFVATVRVVEREA
jgi:hypothetical protein